MDFGIDDGMESDDSFFDDPKPALTAKRASITKISDKEKKNIDDLFSVMDQTTFAKKPDGITSSKSQQVKFTLPLNDDTKIVQKKSDILEDTFTKTEKKTDELLDDLLSSKTHTAASSRTQDKDLFEDLLQKPSSTTKSVPEDKKKQPISFSDILKESRAQTEELPLKSAMKNEQKSGNYSLDVGIKRPGSRGSRRVEDVLGIFGDSDNQDVGVLYKPQKDASIAKNKEKDIPDWLGASSTAKSDTTIASQKTERSGTEPDSLKTEDSSARTKTDNKESQVKKSDSVISNANTNFEMLSLQNSYSNLQQQESLLLVSLQMKKYEENFAEIKKHQEEILQKQENHFDQFLNKFLSRQQIMENEVSLQQERINNHIKMLIGESKDPISNQSLETEIEKKEETDELIKTLKQRHNEEMFLMEESYKKQITLLENSSENVEKRLNNEIEKLTKEYDEKLDNLHQNYRQENQLCVAKIKRIEDQHNEDIKLLKDNHARILEDLKMDYLRQIEHIKESFRLENDLLHDKSSFSEKLQENSGMLVNSSKLLATLHDQVANSFSTFNVARERTLESKEKEIDLMRHSLEQCRERAETERSQLMGLVQTLETKIAEQNHTSKEERWALQQAAATLAARTSALDREAEYNRNAIEWEKEQLKTLKASLLGEQEKITLQLTEEKLQLSAEKARFEVSRKLTDNFEVEKIKKEAETAIQVARELADKLNMERDFIHRQKNELDEERRALVAKENEVVQKEAEVEYLSRNANQKINECRKSMTEAKFLENRYKERLNELQLQSAALANREKKFAEEKLWVSKEKLVMHSNIRKDMSRDCVLCKSKDHDGQQCFMTQYIEDSEAIRIRLNLEEDKDHEVSREENIVLSK